MSRRTMPIDSTPQSPTSTSAPKRRCAIYTRKSSEEGLDMEFNSLDAQREAGEAYIASQRAEGWLCLPDRYDDGGFSGGSMERPALDRLLKDIEAGKVDCVVVYKVDRLSRSLMDFARIMSTFDSRGVSFVSVTQQFNTTSSMGRLTLNILLSFAQFEREIIGERIRDKVAAQKKRGKWAGGVPVLGYDVDRSNGTPKLVINAQEAARVREIFDLYLEKRSLQPVTMELARRGWANKRRVTGKGKEVGGRPFDKATLHALLTNPVLVGKVVHKGQVFQGEHEAIIDPAVFDRVQAQLKSNGRTGGTEARNKYGALLRGILRCKGCGAAMVHTFTGKKGRSYRYYRCLNAIKQGSHACPATTLPAAEMEKVVVDEVRALGRDRGLLDKVMTEIAATTNAESAGLERERDDLKADLTRLDRQLKQLIAEGVGTRSATTRLAEINERIAKVQSRLPEVERLLGEAQGNAITRDEAAAALREFDTLWGCLAPREQARLVALLVSNVEYDATAGTVSVTFRASGFAAISKKGKEAA